MYLYVHIYSEQVLNTCYLSPHNNPLDCYCLGFTGEVMKGQGGDGLSRPRTEGGNKWCSP